MFFNIIDLKECKQLRKYFLLTLVVNLKQSGFSSLISINKDPHKNGLDEFSILKARTQAIAGESSRNSGIRNFGPHKRYLKETLT